METDVAAFARILKQDGIDAARAEAALILEEAQSRAAEIVGQARVAAERALSDAQSEIENRSRRLEGELRLVARDTLLKVREEIERVALLLLKGPIEAALAADEVVRAAVVELARSSGQGREWEIRVGARIGRDLARAVVDDLFKGPGAGVTLVEELRASGLEFRSSLGEVLELSEDSVAAVLRRLMSPELNRLLDRGPG